MEKHSTQEVKSKTIVLKPVGKLPDASPSPKPKIKNQPHQILRHPDCFEGEISPQSNRKIAKNKVIAVQTLENHQKKFTVIENPKESLFSHKKLILLQKINFLLVSVTFMLEITKTQIDMSLTADAQIYGNSLSNVISVSTFFLIFIMFLRYISQNELEIDQKKFYAIRQSSSFLSSIKRFLKNTNSLKLFLIQMLLILPHPTSLLSGYTVQIFQSYDQIYLQHQINNILAICSLFRVYIIFRSLVNLSIYSTPRSSRLCRYNGIDRDFLYSVKCLLREIPLQTICIVFFIMLIILGYGLNLAQGTLLKANSQLPPTGFQKFENCIWCIFITMPTVGYGDIYPKTTLGRIIIFITAISGVIISSLLIVSLSNYLTMQPNESKSHLTLKRLEKQEELRKQASETLVETMKLCKFLGTSSSKNQKEKTKGFFLNLKKKIDRVKLRNRQIKSMVNSNNLMEEMNRLFWVLKESLEQIYRNQVNLRRSLLSMDKNDRKSMKQRNKNFTVKLQTLIKQKMLK